MNCDDCGSRAVVKLRYYGKTMCEGCFSRLLEKRVRKTVRINKLLPSSGRIAVALSGGKDSMTVLKLLMDLTSRNPKIEVVTIVIDEGIRGKKKVFNKVSKYCDKTGVKSHTYSFKEEYGIKLDDIMRKVRDEGVNACTYCGVLRRRLLNTKAIELGVSRIATGHNLDDEVQSSFMNFVRGEYDRTSRLGPIVGVVGDERFVPRIKPLREIPEDEVKLYARLNRIPIASFDCPHAKGAFRRSVKSMLDTLEKRHPGSKYQMLNSTDRLIGLLRQDYAGKKMKYCPLCGEPSSGEKCKVCELLENLR
ncbi:MAG: TIGR00269 family protein [Candidatus Altiarchaeota archaeon]